MDVRVNAELLSVVTTIQDEVARYKHEICELIALGAVASCCELEHQTTEATPWVQDGDTLPCLGIKDGSL